MVSVSHWRPHIGKLLSRTEQLDFATGSEPTTVEPRASHFFALRTSHDWLPLVRCVALLFGSNSTRTIFSALDGLTLRDHA